MNLYTYVAANNPYFVKSLAHKYGHELKKDPNLSFVLEQLVAMHGEQALSEIINVHPDRELFKEYFTKPEEEVKVNASGDAPKVCNVSNNTCTCGCGCGCKSCCRCKQSNQEFVNMSGSDLAEKNRQVLNNTNMMVLAGAVIIAFAIINLK